MNDWDDEGWKPYVPVAVRRKKAEAAAGRAKKAGKTLSPIEPSRGAIARTVWGKAWCTNLEHYSDYANRLPRGRTYVRNGSVIDLVVEPGGVHAQVMGSELYRVDVRVAAVAQKQWKAVCADCAGSIDSMVELLQGVFSTAVMQRLCRPRDGLFPTPKDIEFDCSCPDWASMCKHVAAVLYGIGARLDQQPELLFALRGVDGQDLLAQASADVARPGGSSKGSRVLEDVALGDVFGIEMGASAPVGDAAVPATGRGRKKVTGKASGEKDAADVADRKRVEKRVDDRKVAVDGKGVTAAKGRAGGRETAVAKKPARTASAKGGARVSPATRTKLPRKTRA